METGQVTQILIQSRMGDHRALDALFPIVYEEMSRIAQRQLRAFRPGDTMNTSAVVHEAYLRLIDQTQVAWQDRAHFFATAARAMRFIIVDYARQRGAQKRGGGAAMLSLDDVDVPFEEQAGVLLALNEALTRLGAVDARLAQVVECRYFGGMSEEETARALGVSDRTVRRDWTKARAWLYMEMEADA